MTSKQPLSDRQLTVLQWVADGSPSGHWPEGDFTYKTTCYGLANRRLVNVDRRRHNWHAEITEVGRHYLTHGSYLDDVASKSAPRKLAPPETPKDPPRQPRTPKAPYRAKSDKLVEDVSAAGGTLEVVITRDGPNYDQLVQLAIHRGAVPEGKLLKIERGRRYENRTIILEDPPEWMTLDLAPIPVSQQLRKPHAAINRIRDSDEYLHLPRSVRSRALRLLDALASAATKAGHEVSPTERVNKYANSRAEDHSTLTFSLVGHQFGVEVDEVYKRVPHVPTAQELRKAERDSWFRIPKNDDVASGVVRLTVTRGVPHRQASWTDTSDERSERMLAEILQELELRAHAAEAKQLAEERAAMERRRQWEAAIEEATQRLQEEHRAAVLRAQLEAWELSQRLDAYREQMTEAIAGATDTDERSAAQEWLDWTTTYIQSINPLHSELAMPEPLKATAENLPPYLGGRGFYGPDSPGRW